MKLRIEAISVLSPTIRRFILAADDGAPLPVAGAGAHVMVSLPGETRSWRNAYSVVSGPGMRDHYEIVVRRSQQSRGGSAFLHERAVAGDRLEVGLPQNFFAPSRIAGRHLLLSGGIGITPFLSYIRTLHTPFELHHCCKREDTPAFAGLLPSGATNIVLHTNREELNFRTLLAAQKLDTHLYCCGPEDFMNDAFGAARHLGWPEAKIHRESFGGVVSGAFFTVHLKKSGLTVQVRQEETLLDALEAAGLEPPSLCRGGACGECELPVLAGIPAHHDHYLSDSRRAKNDAIMTCVSRAHTSELVLDF
ncbi:MAG: PDR/VanB family oxidoreductase [Acidiphilium sp.]|nr:PDR/VanB family oxidoreductase [Acidiphilium sp.]MDD4936209.1 PDR/VanB family oxidoreductase [Acidiphilium sp.]